MAERGRGFHWLLSIGIGSLVVGLTACLVGVISEYSSPAAVLVPGGWSNNGVLTEAVGPDGRLYRSEGINSDQIVRVEPDGHVSVIANGIDQLDGLAVDSHGNVFVSENLPLAGSEKPMLGRIVKFQPDGTQELVAEVASPTSLAVDRDGVVYVVDGLTRVLKVSPGGPPEVVAEDPQLDPVGLAVSPAGNLYISDSKNQTVWRRGSDGSLRQLIRPGMVPSPTYLAVNQREEVYVCQTSFDVLPLGPVGLEQALQVPVLIIDRQGNIHRLGVRADPAVLSTQEVAVAPSGDLYLNDGMGVSVVRTPIPLVSVEARALWRPALLLGAALAGLGLALAGSGLVLQLSRN